ncbi:MAG: hypothetical protein FJY83_00955 [Candidatus Aminicenantes bacterium]|nr:hypothetical protein [Candidatus Aminicenantes bacterium]
MTNPKHDFDEELPYPRRRVQAAWGEVEVYEIPDEEKKRVLEKLCPFRPVPNLGMLMEDIHSGKTFRVREFMVTREGKMNVLAAPFYLESGGTVIDWVPARRAKK